MIIYLPISEIAVCTQPMPSHLTPANQSARGLNPFMPSKQNAQNNLDTNILGIILEYETQPTLLQIGCKYLM